MSFSKCEVKRFNDVVSTTPAPTDYDPRHPEPGGLGLAEMRSSRFGADPRDATPGPGQYNTAPPSGTAEKKRSSSASSTDSVFVAPRAAATATAAGTPSHSSAAAVDHLKRRLVTPVSNYRGPFASTPKVKYSTPGNGVGSGTKMGGTRTVSTSGYAHRFTPSAARTSSNSSVDTSSLEQGLLTTTEESNNNSSAMAAPPSTPAAGADVVDYRKRCLQLEAALAKVREGQASQDAAEALKREMRDMKTELDDKLKSLRGAEKEKNELEDKWRALETEKEGYAERVLSLQTELAMLTQDNRTLEETAVEAMGKLELERRELEDKTTFLNFTQEQLNQQVQHLDDTVKQLQSEAHALKEEVASLHHQLELEQEKSAEIMDAYSRENAETLVEFVKLKTDFAHLLAEKKSVQALFHKKKAEVERLDHENIGLHADKNDVQLKLDNALTFTAKLQTQIELLKEELKVAENDRTAMEEEHVRVIKTKTDVELDLAKLSKEKDEVESKVKAMEEDITAEVTFTAKLQTEIDALKEVLKVSENDRTAMEEEHVRVIKDKKDMERDLAKLGKEKDELKLKAKAMEEELQELKSATDKAMEEGKVEALELVKELEMKNSSLEGSLSAAESHIASLTAEVTQLKESARSDAVATELAEEKRKTASLQAKLQQLVEELELQLVAAEERNKLTSAELAKMSAEDAKNMGQQNPNQRIHYMDKIKKVNVELVEENAILKAQVKKLEIKVSKLNKNELLELEDKENVVVPVEPKATAAGAVKKPKAAVTTTIAPPPKSATVPKQPSLPLGPSNRIRK